MRTLKTHIHSFFLCFIIGLVSILPGCYESIEGCLDAKAINYEFEADNDCGECCNYPSIIVSINHYFNSEQFSIDSLYTTETGDEVIISDLFFFISDIAVKNPLGQIFSVHDSFPLSCSINQNDSMMTSSNAIGFIQTQTQSLNLSDFRESGEFSSFIFSIGFNECQGMIDTARLDETSFLHAYLNEEYYKGATGFIALDLEFVESITKDTINIAFSGSDAFYPIEIPISKFTNNGDNLFVTLNVDYGQWMNNINLSEDNEQEIKLKILENLPDVFSIE